MANPRKFSEKIALHNQKQAEETAEYEKIMREVQDCTRSGNHMSKQHLRINQSLGSFRGGSLPNVNNIANNSTVELKPALSNLEEMNGVPGDRPVYGCVTGINRPDVPGGPIRSPRITERRADVSPYSSGLYLHPPRDSNWRRTNSDSALHSTSSTQQSIESQHKSRSTQRRDLDNHSQHDSYEPSRRHLSVSPDGRPRSCCDVPRVPGINIFTIQQEPGTVPIPIGSNTGSLPDLTSFHFPPPLSNPLDQEDHNSSPYSNSPQGTSPSTLSPSSLPAQGARGRFSFGGSPPNESPGPPHYSPHSPTAHTPNHLSVPVNSRFLHTCKGVTVENNCADHSTYQHHFHQQHSPQQQQQHSPQQPPSLQQQSSPSKQHHQHQHHQQPSPHQHQPPPQPQYIYQTAPSPQPPPPQQPLSPHGQTTPPTSVNLVNSINSYRSPQPVHRPSPQNSPGLAVKYGNVSPVSSSPQSPSSPSSTSGNNPFSEHHHPLSQIQESILQQHFEQFNMMDGPVNNFDYLGSTNTISPYPQAEDNCTQELTPDPGYFSTSPSQQLQYARTTNSTRTTPNTPSSIPDIVLTDFSSTGDDLAVRDHPEEFAKELGCSITDSFDSDLFPSDECLRSGLDPVDLHSLQMLTEQDIIADPETEDHFRLDRL